MTDSSNTLHTHVPLWERESQLLRRRLLWMMGVRLFCSTLLMGGTVVFQLRNLQEKIHPTQNFVFWLVGGTYFLTLLYSFFFPRTNQLHRFASIQLSADVVVISLLVMATGCHESLFLFCYLLVIIGAAFLLYRRGAFFFAAASLFMLAVVLFIASLPIAQTLPFMRSVVVLKVPELLYILLVHAPAFFLTALLTSHLAEQVRHTGEILQQQQIDFDNLEALHQDIIESLASGLIAADLEGRIQFFNRCGCELLGLSGEELLGCSLDQVFPALDLASMESISEALYRKKREELPFSHPDGSQRTLGCSFSPLHNSYNEPIGILLLFQDLTPFKQIETIAKEREKLASVGGMAAGLAHEIRNPLSSLSGAVQLLRSELSLEEDDRLLMDIVVKEANRLNRLLSDFLLFARPKTIHKSEYELLPLIDEAACLFRQNPKFAQLDIELSIDEDCLIEVDAELLHQVVWNLMLNAGQAMLPDAGSLRIEGVQKEHGTVLIIEDQGPGIDSELHEQIFEPFFSTKASGTGLGLAVVHRIITEHDGHIELDKQYKGGTRFNLFFPGPTENTETGQEA